MPPIDRLDLTDALRAFEATEANITKLEKLWAEIEGEFPTGNVFAAESSEYEGRCRSYGLILQALPTIDGWKPATEPMSMSEVIQNVIDAREVGEVAAELSVYEHIQSPGKELREYRFRFDQQRRRLVREIVAEHVARIDHALVALKDEVPNDSNAPGVAESVSRPELNEILEAMDAAETLLGGIERPNRWFDMRRHLRFGQRGDLYDIVNFDWPAVRRGIEKAMYAPDEPIPVAIPDLGVLARSHPKGRVPTRLKWGSLTAEEFERLLFSLVTLSPGYENPQWLMRTSAADRGRDISATRTTGDSLAGTLRSRVIIQCRHWLTNSVSPADVTTLRDQMSMWDPPRVDVLVIATSGRFTSDAVALIEKHNQSDRALRIEMWPESHLEVHLARHPGLIAEFRLR